MLMPSKYRKFEFVESALPTWQQRLPDLYETVGPKYEGTRVQGAYVWRAVRYGDTVTLTSPVGAVSQLQVPETSHDFTFAFDLNGNRNWGYCVGSEVHWWYYDNRTDDYELVTFTGTNPVATLDAVGPRSYPPVDVALCYTRGSQLYVRYQRSRYIEEHLLGVLPKGARLRSMGLNKNNRWVFRFENRLPDGTQIIIPEEHLDGS